MDSSQEDLLRQLNEKKIREYAPAIAFSALIVVLGIIGNSMSVVFYGFKVPRTTTNIIITALATVDLVTCVVLSDEIIELCFTLTFKNVGGCKAMYFFNHSLVVTSLFMITLVAYDRFRKICRPFSQQLSILTAKLSFVAIVVFAVAFSVRDWIILDVVSVEIVDDARNATVNVFYCTHTKKEELQTAVQVFQVVDLLILISVIGGTLVFYAFILKRLWDLKQAKHSHKTKDVSPEIIPNTPIGVPCRTNIHVTDKQANTSLDLDHDKGQVAQPSSEQRRQTDDTDDVKTKEQQARVKHNGSSIERQEELGELSNGLPNIESIDRHVANKNDVDRRNPDITTISNNAVNNGDRLENVNRSDVVQSAERKITLMMFAVTFASLLSFVPYFIVNLWIKENSSSSAQEFNVGIQIALRSYMINSAVNPYIMGLFNSKFRTFVKSLLFKCLMCCRK